MPGRALHGEGAELGIRRVEESGDRVAHVHRREEFRIERRAVDAVFVQNAVVPGRFAGFLLERVGNARAECRVVVEIRDLSRCRYAVAEEIEMTERTPIDD